MSRSLAVCRKVAGIDGALVAAVVAGAFALACSDGSVLSNGVIDTPDSTTTGLPGHGIVVSAPVPRNAAAPGAAVADPGDMGLAFVSLPPGSFPNGIRVTIVNRASGASVVAPVVDGGLDPVSIDAAVGDSLRVSVAGPGGLIAESMLRVPARRSPTVARTSPPARKRDVPLNSIVIIVFSHPVDPASLGGAIQLLRGDTLIPAALNFVDSAHTAVAIAPEAALRPGADYQVAVSTGLTDVTGSRLEAPFVASFTTGTSVAGPVASITVEPDTVTTLLGSSVQFVAVARDAQGTVVYPSLTWTSSAESVATTDGGRVTTRGFGTSTISAAAEGKVGSGRVTVTSATPIAAILVSPESATIALGDSIQLSAVARDSLGRAIIGALITWGSNDVGVVDVRQSGMVTTVGPGIATVSAFGGPMAGPNYGSASVRVTLSSVVSITLSPDSATLDLFDTLRLSAVVRNAAGTRLSGAPIAWSSTNPGIASVDSLGLVTPHTSGAVTIRAATAGQVATAGVVVTSQPVPSGLVFASVSSGGSHSCGVTTAGEAYCWGSNVKGQLGDSTNRTSAVPVRVRGGHSFRSISAGNSYTCAVTTANAAWCWGWNEFGQLGAGSGVDSRVPLPVSGGLSFTSVSTGDYFACGVTTTNVAWCWGAEPNRIGISSAPVAVPGGLSFASVVASENYACGVTTTGAGYCWGSNYYGTLGVGDLSRQDRAGPTAIAGGLTFAALSGGGLVTCGVTTAGGNYCWGIRYFPSPVLPPEQFYDPNDYWTYSWYPEPARLFAVPALASITLAHLSYCGLTSIGEAYCWGANRSGELGNGSTTESVFALTRVAGGLTFSSLSIGYQTTCGVTTGGVAYCWGNNDSGQLGIGSKDSSSLPVKVAGQP